MTIDSLKSQDALGMIARDVDGNVKDIRYVLTRFHRHWEFIPNKFYIKLINSGHVTPNTWKIPFLFGSWSSKEIL